MISAMDIMAGDGKSFTCKISALDSFLSVWEPCQEKNSATLQLGGLQLGIFKRTPDDWLEQLR